LVAAVAGAAGAAPPPPPPSVVVDDRDAITSAGASMITPFLRLMVNVFGLLSE
jgi:ABC-type phosphate transport system substrate-binding protein